MGSLSHPWTLDYSSSQGLKFRTIFLGLFTMANIANLLDKAKVIHKLPSDYKLALVMGVKQTTLKNYRDGVTLPDARVITLICGLTGDDPALLAAEIEAERAKTDEARALWQTIARRLSLGAAAGITATVLSGCLWVGDAVASPVAQLDRLCILCKVTWNDYVD